MENNLYLSRFWTRVWALLFDAIILGMLGLLLGLTFKNLFFSLGDSGRIIGWVISLVYFTVLNSKINNGQTLGKKVMNIQVTDIEGNPVSLKTSFIRALILTTPFFLNGLSIPGANVFSLISIAQLIVILTLDIGIMLFYIINKKTRQSFHDIATKTYVVDVLRNDEVTLMPKLGKLPFYVLGGLFLIGMGLAVYSANNDSKIAKLMPAYENILKLDNVSEASVTMNLEPETDVDATKRFMYTVTITTTRNIEEKVGAEDDITSPELKSAVEAFINSKVHESDNDLLKVVINSGFDIGIYNQNRWFGRTRSISEWKEVYRL